MDFFDLLDDILPLVELAAKVGEAAVTTPENTVINRDDPNMAPPPASLPAPTAEPAPSHPPIPPRSKIIQRRRNRKHQHKR